MQRKIIHIDADCFFAAIEMRDNPYLKDKAIAVGGKEDKRGVIATCNYLARQFGVRSAMPSRQAKKMCPALIIVPGRMSAYRQASQLMRDIFLDYTDAVEPLSLDEAFLDVTDCSLCHGSATLIAEEIRQRVESALSITVSAGVAPNKFLAKVASDWQKPNGLTVITPDDVDDFVKGLAVTKIHGVGRVTAEKMSRVGITTCADIRLRSIFELTELFGSFGARLYDFSYGRDERTVISQRRRKSLSVESTYSDDLVGVESCLSKLAELLLQLQTRLEGLDDSYKVIKVFVKVKFSNFHSTSLERLTQTISLQQYSEMLAVAVARSDQAVRLLGLGVRFVDSHPNSKNFQLSLFDDQISDKP